MREHYLDLFIDKCQIHRCFYKLSLLILILVNGFFYSLNAQDHGEACGNVHLIPNNHNFDAARLKEVKNKLGSSALNSLFSTPVKIPIKLHIVRNTNGTTNFDLQSFFSSFMELNNKFRSRNIQFYLLNDIKYIDNSTYYAFDAQNEESLLCDPNDVLNAINMYYVDTILFFNGLYASGYAYYPSPSSSSNRMVITNGSLTSARTMSHEMGHYFNLLHTYQNNGNNDLNLREKVSRTNCTTAGDMLCDTPADPYGLSGATISGCVYTGTITDSNGDRFTPLMNNTMSYYNSACGDVFTSMQFGRVEDGYLLRTLPSNTYSIAYVASNVNTPSTLSSSIVASKVRLTFTDLANNEVGYFIERKINPSGEYKTIGYLFQNETVYTDNDLVSNTSYTYRVRAINSALYSNETTITTTVTYCTPSYSFTCDLLPVNIEQFAIVGTTLNSVNSDCSPNSYSKITTNTPDLNIDQTYTFNASTNKTTGSSYFAQHLTIWIDYNIDGNFTSNEIIFKTTASTALNPAKTATFKVPNTALPGLSILRVRSQYADDGLVDDPCILLQMGETEDYTVNIKGTSAVSDIKINSISPLTVCTNSEFNVNYQRLGSTPLDSTAFVVQIGDAAGQFMNLNTTVAGNLLTATIPASQAAGTYKIRIKSISPNLLGTESISNLLVKVKPVSGISIIDGLCINTNAAYTAIPAAANATYSWNFGQDASPASSNTATGSVQWTTPGTKNISLTVGLNGCESTYSFSKTIEACTASGFIVKAKFFPEGLWNGTVLRTDLLTKNLLPKPQPFNKIPWNYTGTETVIDFPANTSDWVFVVARRIDGTVLAKKPALLRNDGILMAIDGTEGIDMGALTGDVHVSIHHKSHVAVMSNATITSNVLYDFTNAQTQAKGTAQQKMVSTAWCMYAGDLDQNGINNNLDFNAWKIKGAAINQYLHVDADANGIVNNLDANLWMRNRSKVGIVEVRGF